MKDFIEMSSMNKFPETLNCVSLNDITNKLGMMAALTFKLTMKVKGYEQTSLVLS